MAQAGHIKVRIGKRVVIVRPVLVRGDERATARPYEVRG
jgi:hypothetical protein